MLVFLLIAFLWSWIFWLIGLHHLSAGITDETMDRFARYFYIGVYGPSISAIITTYYFDGFRGVIALLKKLLLWKTSLVIYLVIFFLPLLLIAAGIGIHALFIDNVGHFDRSAITAAPLVLWAALFAGPLGEELGWRGFLLPAFQNSYSPVKSSLIIGVIWYCWHIPLFFAPFGTLVSGATLTILPLITYLAMIVCLSCLCTWAVNRSKGSVLIAILTHLFANAGLGLLFFPQMRDSYKLIYLLSTPAIIIFTLFIAIRTRLR
ncbi:MAG: type II CAAX endopeptidase family protein [Agriterribacter sp.]